LATVAIFLPGATGGFVFDDYPNIVSNPRVHAERLDLDALRVAASAYEPGGSGRALATMSFAANHALGGKDPYGYKVFNIGLHALNAWLVYLLTLAVFRRVLDTPFDPRVAALFAALAWSVHPLQVSTVLYVVQRMEMLAATFILASLWCYLAGRSRQLAGERGWHWLCGSVLLAGLGLAGKETALLTPVYALAIEAILFRFGATRPATQRVIRAGWGALVAAAGVLYLFVVLPPYLDPAIYSLRDYSLAERLMTQARVLPMYLGWIVAPLPGSLHFYYDTFEPSRGWLQPATTLAGGLFLLGLAALAIAWRRRSPLVALGILWFFASHVLTSNVMPFELVFEHRNYLALLGPLWAAGAAMAFLHARGLDSLARILPFLLVAGLASQSVIRAATWGEPLLLATFHVSQDRASPRASNDLGEQYFLMAGNSADSPFYWFAMREFERGSQLPKSSPLPEQALIILSITAGQEPQQAWWDRIDRKLTERPIGPQEGMTVMGMLRKRMNGMAIDDYRLSRSLEILFERGQLPANAYAEYGDYALGILGNADLSTRMFVQSVSVAPRDPAYGQQVLRVLEESGHVEQADAVRARLRELGDLPSP
jgi:hypothetical protein